MVFHRPLPGFTTMAFSVCLKAMNNGAADVSCLITAFKYWSRMPLRQTRSQGPVAANRLALPTRANNKHARIRADHELAAMAKLFLSCMCGILHFKNLWCTLSRRGVRFLGEM